MTMFRYVGNGRFTYTFEEEVKKVTRGEEFEVSTEDELLFREYNDLVVIKETKVSKPKYKKELKVKDLEEE